VRRSWGERLYLSPELWREADDFVPQRFEEPDTPRLLSFGGGPHYCLGAALPRTTIEEAVRAVAALAPALSEDSAGIEWVQILGQSPVRLVVTVSGRGVSGTADAGEGRSRWLRNPSSSRGGASKMFADIALEVAPVNPDGGSSRKSAPAMG
jgi:hypothetical protein